ncbi:PEP-CTERM sorting domain-containing protein [Nitrosomonas oligotropha]|nr:PEP-CTERM sorting domain-containing protein [Nitrosomonas oligotropha]
MVHADWSIKGLGTLGGAYSEAFGINDSGQVVGWANTASGSRHAFITGPSGAGMTDLGTLGGSSSWAFGINDSGQVVGSSYLGNIFNQHAFITGPNGNGMTDLGTLGGISSGASGINDSGQVVGGSYTASWNSHAFITGPNGLGMTDLGTLGGGSSWALGINNSGQVVGSSYLAGNFTQDAFITGPNGIGMTDLGTLGGHNSMGVIDGAASGINDSGQVVGGAFTASGNFDAFITGPNGIGMTDLGTLGGDYSYASGINDSGEVVGAAATAAGEDHAFIFSHGEMTDLSSLAPVVAAGWTDISALSINNNGQIVGFGHHHGNHEAFLLSFTTAVPEPETYLMLLAGLGLIGYLARRRKEMVI